MRVATRTLYESGMASLGQALSDLSETNEKVVTGKKINSPSDDPTGYVRALTLEGAVAEATQSQKNIGIAEGMLAAGENALDSMQETILSARDLAIEMSGNAVNEEDMKIAAEEINGLIMELENLSSTQVSGQYLFSGTDTDTPPITLTGKPHASEASYNGSGSSMKLSTGGSEPTPVTLPGSQVFYASEVTIDGSCCSVDFCEDGNGAQLTAVIPEGSYTREELAMALELSMEKASGLPFKISGVSGPAGVNPIVSVAEGGSLVQASSSPVTLDWDGNIWTVTDNGGFPAAAVVSVENSAGLDLDGDGKPDVDLLPDSSMAPGSVSFEIGAGTPVDYEVTCDAETGLFEIGRADGGGLDLLWDSGSHSGTSAGVHMGFGGEGDSIGSSSYQGEAESWGMFETLIDLRDALDEGDTDGVSRSISQLNTHYEDLTAIKAGLGMEMELLESRDYMLSDLSVNFQSMQSETQDVDIVAAVADFNAKQLAYESALACYSKITQISVLNYF